jgi:peptide-methionine (R)-S-oxide reductase
MQRTLPIVALSLVALTGVAWAQQPPPGPPVSAPEKIEKIVKTEAEWRKQLTPNQYYILRRKGTEPPFRNAYHNNHLKGTYSCAACGLTLFTSATKFDSGTGWPSFWQPVKKLVVSEHADADGSGRVEVMCARCGGHLGHVFDDGPAPTGLRYCMNSGALKFTADKKP